MTLAGWQVAVGMIAVDVITGINRRIFSVRVFSCRAQENFTKWLEQEYEPEVDWSKVPVDTPILVKVERSSDKWFERHFAYYHDGKVYAWNNGRTSYTTQQDPPSVWQYAKLYTGDKVNDRT